MNAAAFEVPALENELTRTSRETSAKPSVLIVEGEALLRDLVSDTLRAERYAVLAAGNTDDARSILGALQIDLVLTGQRLSGAMNGIGFVQWLRKEHPAVRVIMMSGEPPAATICQQLHGYLRKPFRTSELVQYLEMMTACAEQDR